jgi:hypothetical protein
MIALQIALSIAALYAALVVARGVSGYMQGVGTPREEQIITARVTFPDDAALRDSVLRALDVVRALPGVQSAGLATSLPRLSPPTRLIAVRRDAFTRAAEARSAPVVAISPGFVETLGAEVTTGRAIDDSDLHANAPPVAVVNEPFVAKFFGGVNPVGQQLQLLDADSGNGLAVWHEIVGVVPDLGLSVGDERLAGGVYIPIREEPLFYLAASVDGDANAIGRLLPRTLASTDPRIQVREVQRLPDVGREDRAVFAGLGAALTSLGVIALALSVIGVYAMLSFAVTSRTREIAIRSALGATRAQVLWNVLGRAAVPLAIGVIAGPALGTALVAARGIFAFRLPADAEPWAIPTLTVIVAAAAVTASFMPARRALRVNTSDALRGE